jgi:predicted transcriptional regulator
MKESFVMKFGDRELEVVEILKSLGVPRKVSNMIAYLASVEEATSRDIERGSELRQPEVSLALRTLRVNHWIHESIRKNDGTGRPMKVYRLSAPVEEILQHYEEEKVKEAYNAIERINKLRSLLTEAESAKG